MKKLIVLIAFVFVAMTTTAFAADRCANYAHFMKGDKTVAVKAQECRKMLYRDDCKRYSAFSKNPESYMAICKEITYEKGSGFASAD